MSRSIRNLLLGLLIWASALVPAAAQFADQATYIASTGGSGNAQTITIPNVGSLGDILGVQIKVKPSFTNTGAMTLNPNTLGAVAVNKTSAAGPVALTGSEFVSSPAQTVTVMYDGTRFLILSDVNSSPTSIFPSPQGYLTPCPAAGGVTGCTAGNLVPTGDVASATSLYYTPGPNGNQIPVYNGSSMVTYQFSELTLALGSSNLANTLYDVCVTTTTAGAYSINGNPTIVTSVAWTTSTPGSGARGTGASTAQIARVSGIETNAVQIDGKNGGTTYTAIPANRCTIVGTILIDASNGQVTFHRTVGQSRRWAAWNFYNRQPITLQVTDPNASWAFNTVTAGQPANGSSANSAIVLSGLAEEIYDIRYVQQMQSSGTGSGSDGGNAIGFNSTSTLSGKIGRQQMGAGGGGSVAIGNDLVAQFVGQPALGAQTITALQFMTNNTNTHTLYGTVSNMLLTASWRG